MMRVTIIFLIIIAAVAAVLLITPKKAEVADISSDKIIQSGEVSDKSDQNVLVKHSIDPLKILDQKCSECHGRKKTKGSFNIVRLLESGLKKEEVDYWNDVYRAVKEGDMPPEDEEQLTAEEKSILLMTLENKLQSSRETSRLLTADEIINTLSDAFEVDALNDNQMDNLYSYQNTEHYSTVNNEEIMSVFFMNDYSQILDGIINEYVKASYKPSKKKPSKKTESSSRWGINTVGFASKSFIHEEGQFVDLRGRYSPHANALKKGSSKDLNLAPGKYKITFKAGAFNRSAIKSISKNANNGLRLLKEKAKLNFYTMPVYRKTRPSSYGRENLVTGLFIDDNVLKEYSVIVDLKRKTPIGLSFENGPFAGHLRRAVSGSPKSEVPSKEYKHPYIRFQDINVELLTPAANVMSLKQGEENDSGFKSKIEQVISTLGVSVSSQDIMSIYSSGKSSGLDAFMAYKKALKAIFLSPDFLYIKNSGSVREKTRFASYALLKSYPDKSFKALYESLLSKKISQSKFTALLSRTEKFRRFTDRFTYEWLDFEEMAANQPDEEIFQEFYTENLSYAFVKQTQLFINNLFKSSLPVSDIVQSDYTFANDNLRRFYGLPATQKTGYEVVPVKGSMRGGLFTQGSFLTSTSNGVEALPFRRAKWISENILNKTIPPPPDNISVQEFEEAKGTFAEKMKVHSTSTECAGCHKLIDPIADTMRYFDSIGRVEKHFSDQMVSPEVTALKSKYAKYTHKTAIALCRNLISYATGRKTDISDYQTAEKIVADCKSGGFKVNEIFAGIVKHYF